MWFAFSSRVRILFDTDAISLERVELGGALSKIELLLGAHDAHLLVFIGQLARPDCVPERG
ncbi:hypothetical protein Q675_00145 [Labrenzia sp. C1B70]|nr:hypothetical protein Q675_00145 [Labrenzia sp. C1B70]